MSIKALEQMGAFVDSAPVQKEIRFRLDGDEEHVAIIHVRKLSMGEYERLFVKRDDKYGTSARVISEAIGLGDDGLERISVEKAFRLHKGIAGAMLDAFNEVNGSKN